MDITYHDEDEFDRWFRRLGTIEKAQVAERMNLLEESPRPLDMPQGRDLKGGVWELRTTRGPRVYYTPIDSAALILTQGRKDTQAADIARARRRKP